MAWRQVVTYACSKRSSDAKYVVRRVTFERDRGNGRYTGRKAGLDGVGEVEESTERKDLGGGRFQGKKKRDRRLASMCANVAS